MRVWCGCVDLLRETTLKAAVAVRKQRMCTSWRARRKPLRCSCRDTRGGASRHAPKAPNCARVSCGERKSTSLAARVVPHTWHCPALRHSETSQSAARRASRTPPPATGARAWRASCTPSRTQPASGCNCLCRVVYAAQSLASAHAMRTAPRLPWRSTRTSSSVTAQNSTA